MSVWLAQGGMRHCQASAPEIIAAARAEFPGFADMIDSLCC